MLHVSKRIKYESTELQEVTLAHQFKRITIYKPLKINTMNNLRNKVILIGHLGADPEVMVFDSGKKKVKFSLATSDNYKNSNGDKVENTQWHNIILWGKPADIAEKYLRKGSEVAVDGKLQYRSYEDQNGDKKYITEISAFELLLLGKKS